MDRDGDADTLSQIDTFEVGVQQSSLDGVHLLVHHHYRGGLAALDRQIENGVIPRVAMHDLDDFAGVDRNADGVLESAINNRWDFPVPPSPARFVLAARGAHLSDDTNIFSQCNL